MARSSVGCCAQSCLPWEAGGAGWADSRLPGFAGVKRNRESGLTRLEGVKTKDSAVARVAMPCRSGRSDPPGGTSGIFEGPGSDIGVKLAPRRPPGVAPGRKLGRSLRPETTSIPRASKPLTRARDIASSSRRHRIGFTVLGCRSSGSEPRVSQPLRPQPQARQQSLPDWHGNRRGRRRPEPG